MLNFHRKFFAPSAAKALKGFHKALDQLLLVNAIETEKAEKADRKAVAAAAVRDESLSRAGEAMRIHDKLRDLVA